MSQPNLFVTYLLVFGLLLFWICPLAFAPLLARQSSDNQMRHQSSVAWEAIAPYFSPPAALDNSFGDYRSPLLFENGKQARSKRAWKHRRSEILRKWHGLMGTWPQINERPATEVLQVEEKEGYLQKKIAFEWVPGQRTTAYLLIPYGAVKSAAVITVYYEPETAVGLGRPDLTDRDFARQLTRRGFVTLSLGTTESTLNETYSIYYPSIEQATVEPLSMLAYAAATSWHLLAQLPEVDPERIGIMGHSYGGKWAMFASCLYDKFAAAAWSDPGIVFQQDRPSINYWEPWYLGYHPPPWRARGIPTADNPAVGLYPRLLAKGMDLHELHALMAPRPFLVSGGSEDPLERWIPLNHSRAVNKLLGHTDRLGMTNRPEHAPNEASNQVIMDFFSYFLKLQSDSR
ncbi:alpha/beta hydrolase family protein [Lunatimonas salinarum]|uniref:alpha/beta hydrolase family protein n=1 Tax=Lunatimonas salinarum TaxID=1774590 RepID=UPI001AE0ADA5|nr:prolyl oligopeptidase family serine peptidase [Lunatimonas salinarum]